MAWHRAYYSVIQYCPDLGRLESANVGVILFCPELHYLNAKTARTNERIARFFGRDSHDWKRINALKKGIEERVLNSCSEIQDRETFSRFIELQANLMQLTSPMECKVSDQPDGDLQRLFDEIVTAGKNKSASSPSVRHVLEQKFSRAKIEDRIIHDLKVEVPVLGREVDIPFGFQNGRFNLITPVRFESKNIASAERTACQYAVQGRSLFEHADEQLGNLQLLIVGKFRPSDQATRTAVHRVLEDNHVKLYRFDQVPALIDDIRNTAKIQRS